MRGQRASELPVTSQSPHPVWQRRRGTPVHPSKVTPPQLPSPATCSLHPSHSPRASAVLTRAQSRDRHPAHVSASGSSPGLGTPEGSAQRLPGEKVSG